MNLEFCKDYRLLKALFHNSLHLGGNHDVTNMV